MSLACIPTAYAVGKCAIITVTQILFMSWDYIQIASGDTMSLDKNVVLHPELSQSTAKL